MNQEQYDRWLAIVKDPKISWGQNALHNVAVTYGKDVIDRYCVWGMYALANSLRHTLSAEPIFLYADTCGHVTSEQLNELMWFNDDLGRTREEVIEKVIELHDKLVSVEVGY